MNPCAYICIAIYLSTDTFNQSATRKLSDAPARTAYRRVDAYLSVQAGGRHERYSNSTASAPYTYYAPTHT